MKGVKEFALEESVSEKFDEEVAPFPSKRKQAPHDRRINSYHEPYIQEL